MVKSSKYQPLSRGRLSRYLPLFLMTSFAMEGRQQRAIQREGYLTLIETMTLISAYREIGLRSGKGDLTALLLKKTELVRI